jgi:molybdopterin converting factor small subunit
LSKSALMTLTVEFLGISRQLTGAKECQLELDQGATLQDAVGELARRFPRLLRERVINNGSTLSESFRLTVDGRHVRGLDTELKGDERLLLISATWGG